MKHSKPIRWWPLYGIGLLSIALAVFLGTKEYSSQQTMVTGILAWIFVTLTLVFLWLMLLSRLPWGIRLRSFLFLAILFGGFSLFFRIEGFTGDFVPVVAWRWESGTEYSAAVSTAPASSNEQNWIDYPQFRGANRLAVLSDIALNPDWESSPPEEIWRVPIGEAWSSFAVSGSYAVTMAQDSDGELVLALDLLSGKTLWAHQAENRYESVIGGNGPRATPTIEGSRVYAVGGLGQLMALELETGKMIWQRNILKDAQKPVPEWGFAGSPLVHDDMLIINAGGADGRSLAAYSLENGEPIWFAGDSPGSYSSPVLATVSGVPQIVIFNSDSIAGHDPKTGDVLWQSEWPRQQPNVAMPLLLPGDKLLVSSGYGIGATLYQISKQERAFEVKSLWESPRIKSKFAPLFFHDGYIYGLDDGTFTCVDPVDGARQWKSGRYGHGQMILVGNHFLLQTEKGQLVLIEPNPESLREIAKMPVLEGKSWNPPAFAAPYLLMRNHKEAVCLKIELLEQTAEL